MNVTTFDAHLPAVRAIQSAKDLQQCGLAGARSADDGHTLGRCHAQLQAMQHIQSRRALLERARDITRLQYRDVRFIHDAVPPMAPSAPRARPDKW